MFVSLLFVDGIAKVHPAESHQQLPGTACAAAHDLAEKFKIKNYKLNQIRQYIYCDAMDKELTPPFALVFRQQGVNLFANPAIWDQPCSKTSLCHGGSLMV